jgi:acetyl esterase/lipase
VRHARRLLLPLLLIGASAMAATIQFSDMLARPHPAGAIRIAYGHDPLQHADLWLPSGAGPHPVVLMLHGGCWQTSVATADLMDHAADDLRRRGIAVWNLEYRGVDRPGGGWPGTFEDVQAGLRALKANAARYRLRTDRIVALGHSAGGHLALWLAAKGGVAAAISLGGLPDLEAASVPPGNTCGTDAVDRLVGKRQAGRTDPYADTSPARMAQPAIPITLVNGSEDHIAPPAIAAAYAARVRNPRLRTVLLSGAGHFELIAPETAAWAAIVRDIEAALR